MLLILQHKLIMMTIGLAFLLLSGLEAFVPSQRQSRPSFLVTTQFHSDKGNFKGSFSFVEDSDFFASEEEEIEAMGGDPSFLPTNDDVTDWTTPPKEEEQVSKEPTDSTPAKFEWDGEVDEDAYFD